MQHYIEQFSPRKLLYVLSAISFFISLLWLWTKPDFEPLLILIGSLILGLSGTKASDSPFLDLFSAQETVIERRNRDEVSKALREYIAVMTELLVEREFNIDNPNPTLTAAMRAYSNDLWPRLNKESSLLMLDFLADNGILFLALNLTGVDLSNTELRGLNFKKAILDLAFLREADLSHINLEGARLKETNLIGVNLYQANLANSYLVKAILIDANLKFANLTKANLTNADITNCKLAGADLSNAIAVSLNFTGQDLSRTKFIQARVRNSQFDNCDLSFANFSGASLREVSFKNANLSNTNFQKADLWETDFSGSNVYGSNLEGSKIYDNTKLDAKGLLVWQLNNKPGKHSQLVHADLTQANLQRADLSNVNLRSCNLSLANLKEANLDGAKLLYANLEGANFRQIWYESITTKEDEDCPRASLNGANLAYANLKDALIEPYQLEKVQSLIGAIMPNGKKYNRSRSLEDQCQTKNQRGFHLPPYNP
jgi:uncharacterized protein YjbI with pentapeptide repeats